MFIVWNIWGLFIAKELFVNIRECPGCHHARPAHKEGNCYRLVEAVTAGGEGVLVICGHCGWIPIIFENGTRGWRHDAGRPAEAGETNEEDQDEVAAALLEVNRILGSR